MLFGDEEGQFVVLLGHAAPPFRAGVTPSMACVLGRRNGVCLGRDELNPSNTRQGAAHVEMRARTGWSEGKSALQVRACRESRRERRLVPIDVGACPGYACGERVAVRRQACSGRLSIRIENKWGDDRSP